MKIIVSRLYSFISKKFFILVLATFLLINRFITPEIWLSLALFYLGVNVWQKKKMEENDDAKYHTK